MSVGYEDTASFAYTLILNAIDSWDDVEGASEREDPLLQERDPDYLWGVISHLDMICAVLTVEKAGGDRPRPRHTWR